MSVPLLIILSYVLHSSVSVKLYTLRTWVEAVKNSCIQNKAVWEYSLKNNSMQYVLNEKTAIDSLNDCKLGESASLVSS